MKPEGKYVDILHECEYIVLGWVDAVIDMLQ